MKAAMLYTTFLGIDCIWFDRWRWSVICDSHISFQNIQSIFEACGEIESMTPLLFHHSRNSQMQPLKPCIICMRVGYLNLNLNLLFTRPHSTQEQLVALVYTYTQPLRAKHGDDMCLTCLCLRMAFNRPQTQDQPCFGLVLWSAAVRAF